MSPRRAAPAASPPDLRAVRILATVDSVPAGRVATYAQIAAEAGLPRRARLVGKVLSALPAASGLPWHRIVNAAGRISPRPGRSVERQRRRLRREGIPVDARDRVDLARFRWEP